MPNGSITEQDPTDPEQGLSPAQPGQPQIGPQGGGGGPPQPGGFLAAMARNAIGPQVSAPGPGDMADGVNKLTGVITMLQDAAKGFPPTSPIFRELHTMIARLAKHVGSTSAPSAGAQNMFWLDGLRRNARNMLLQRVMQPAMQPQGGGAPPNPSTPLPGA
jgi:hypothetical protein